MGTATSENAKLNEHLPHDRPKVYPCTDCGNGFEFTKLALEAHKKHCLHQASCHCVTCRFKPRESVEVNKRKLVDLNLLAFLDFANKRIKLPSNCAPVVNGFSTNNLIINLEEPSPPIELITLDDCEIKAPEVRSESSDSWENSHSDDSQRVQTKRLLYLKPLAFVDPKSTAIIDPQSTAIIDPQCTAIVDTQSTAIIDPQCTAIVDTQSTAIVDTQSTAIVDTQSILPRPRPVECADTLENNHDGEPCNRKIYCVICDKHIFWESFGTHVLRHSIKIENSHLVCPQCNLSFRSPNLYLLHFPAHLANHDCSKCHCDHPKCVKKSAVPSPEHSYAGDNTCFICLKTLNGNPSIVVHLKIHCKECPFTCEECHRSFRQTGNLQRHLLAHRGEKPHKCHSCGTGFSDPATLRNHVRTHTKETPFVCKVCKRGFSQVGNLKRHMALHVEKEKDSSVLIVKEGQNEKSIGVVEEEIGPDDEKSSGSELMSDSEARKTGDAVNFPEPRDRIQKRSRNGQFKLHVCKLCGKKYAWRHDLNIHFRTHTGEKPYKCELCDKQFAQSGAVRMHNARHHSKHKLNAKKLTPRLKNVSTIST